MRKDALERATLDFIARKFDVLLATTIVENGLVIPNANTIIINRADRYGLSELVQLRQAIAVGPVDDDRVRVGDDEAVLDDRRRQEHVELPGDEVERRALQRVLPHLAVADDASRFRHEP